MDTSILYIIIFLVVIGLLFYFFMIRPQRRRQKDHQSLLDKLQRGDRVVTAGGIYGEVDSVNPENIILKVESGATIRVSKTSIVSKL